MALNECVKFNSGITDAMGVEGDADSHRESGTDPWGSLASDITSPPSSGLYKGLDISTGTCRSLTAHQLSSCC